jgi:hypothetical protein
MSSRAVRACRCRRSTASVGGRRRDAQVHLAGAGVAQHFTILRAGGAPHDGVVDHDHARPWMTDSHRVELQLHAEVADGLRGLDERAAGVVASDEAHLEGQVPAAWAKPMAAGTPLSGTGMTTSAPGAGDSIARIGGPSLAHVVHVRGPKTAVGAGEVDVLEDARSVARRAGRRAARSAPLGVDHQHLARLDLAHELRGDEVEGRGLARDTWASVEDAQGPAGGSRGGRAPR